MAILLKFSLNIKMLNSESSTSVSHYLEITIGHVFADAIDEELTAFGHREMKNLSFFRQTISRIEPRKD